MTRRTHHLASRLPPCRADRQRIEDDSHPGRLGPIPRNLRFMWRNRGPSYLDICRIGWVYHDINIHKLQRDLILARFVPSWTKLPQKTCFHLWIRHHFHGSYSAWRIWTCDLIAEIALNAHVWGGIPFLPILWQWATCWKKSFPQHHPWACGLSILEWLHLHLGSYQISYSASKHLSLDAWIPFVGVSLRTCRAKLSVTWCGGKHARDRPKIRHPSHYTISSYIWHYLTLNDFHCFRQV